MKKFLFSLTLFFLCCIVFFVIGEIMFRIFRGAPNPLSEIVQEQSNYLFKPNTVKTKNSSIEGEFQYTAHINKFGYRGEDFSLRKKDGVIRIFAVGDSFTYGVGTQDDETIPFLIEQNLTKKGAQIEVINAGIGHASPIQHYVNLRDIHLQYQPDLVLLLLDLTDLWDDWHTERNAVYDQKGDVIRFDPTYINGKRDWWITATYYSAFCRYVHNKIVRSFKKIQLLGFRNYIKIAAEGKRAKAEIINSEIAKAKQAQIEYDGLLMMRGQAKKELIDEHFKRSAKYLTKIKELLDQNGIPLIIIMYPHGIYVDGDQWNEGRKTWGFETGKQYKDYYPFELVASYAKANAIPFINTLDSFLNAPKKKYFYDWDGHMTPAGYKMVADSIVQSEVFKKILNKI